MKLEREEFVKRFSHVFESSPWFAEEVYDRHGGQYQSADELADRFETLLMNETQSRQMALLRAHPELACAVRTDLTDASRQEQAGAGLDNCSQAEADAFASLNERYMARFGFPFIIAVRGLDRQAILERFSARIENDPGREFKTALREVCRIARLRINDACAR